MPPPATIPSRPAVVRPSSRSRKEPCSSPSEEGHEQRQRVISNASSTFSIKSAPSRPAVEHKPPVRLASSQSGQNPVPVSSGPARRIPRVISIEPHPANHSDLFAAARRAVTGVATRPGLAQAKSKGNGTIAFPTIGGGAEDTLNERKGPQRVLKLVPPPLSTVSLSNSKAEDTTQPTHAPKRELKTSIFRRAAPEASDKGKASIDAKQSKLKDKEGFIPRRGLTQPTVSQLNKQRTRVTSTTGKKSAVLKPSTLKAKSKPRAAKTQGALEKGTELESTAVSEAITPLPHLVPLPASPETTMMPEKPEIVDEGLDYVPEDAVASEDMRETDDAAEHLQGDQLEAVEGPAEPHREEDAHSMLSTPTPQTPPFPITEDEDESHELDHIEFTKGEVYDSAGMAVKTPRKTRTISDEDSSDSLREVILNE